MKTYKTGDLIEYKIPVFVCTKCNYAYAYDPAMIFMKNFHENNLVPSTIEKCSCGNDEFNYKESYCTVGVGAETIKFK
ncbi:MAG: hypothetical protein RR191_05485 [Cetobacterium sp.]|uniref:hypothetical protein n=1 Tax=Cetobacterium sp. TaxID=2071632 RepID=UPI002FCC9B3C